MMLSKRLFSGTIALIGWFAIIAQFIITVLHSELASTEELTIQFFSYFTILTNLMVALCCTSLALIPTKRIGVFFSKASTITGVTLYILIVAIIYNFILRFLWQPQGMQKIVDELLHLVVPALFLLFWWFAIDKRSIQWKHVFYWLIFPLTYFAYTLWRGSFSGFYPYPFLDVPELGMEKVLINSVAISLVFILIGSLLIAAGKWQSKLKG